MLKRSPKEFLQNMQIFLLKEMFLTLPLENISPFLLSSIFGGSVCLVYAVRHVAFLMNCEVFGVGYRTVG
jgi:hypothetical protein